MNTLPITKIFWSILTIEVVGFAILLIVGFRSAGRSPDGGLVGAWLIFVPPVVWIITAILFYRTDSPSKQLTYTIFLALPLIQIVLGPLYEKTQHAIWAHGARGADYFVWPAQRQLANAIYDHDVERAKQLIAAAGDLNKPYKQKETLFRFAITNVDDSDSSLELIRAMLAAGANPNYPPTEPLYFAIYRGPRLTKLLLEAGADPNALESADRPVWWSVLSASKDEDLTTLRLLLDHGADVKKRDREGGPVAWAAHNRAWRALWLLIERGADWKDEKEFGTTVQYMLANEVNYREHSHMTVPEELRKALAKYETATE
jgi:hypothetical protein